MPSATLGVSDRFDVSGTVFVSFGSDDFAVAPVVGAKLGLVDTGSFAAAVGTSVGFAFSDGNGGALITPYAAVALGSEIRSVSASVAVFAGTDLGTGDFYAADNVLVAFGGEVQVNNGVKLLFDVLGTISDDVGAVGLVPGVRLFGDRYSVDVFGTVVVAFDDDSAGLGGFAPLANFSFMS